VSTSSNPAVNLVKVLQDEKQEVKELCENRDAVVDLAQEQSSEPAAHLPERLGVAFSGGGIRSASVNLGLIQALARCRLLSSSNKSGSGQNKNSEQSVNDDLLRHVHYLSGISGGGYILGWLTAWISRNGFNDVQEQLESNEAPCPPSTTPAGPGSTVPRSRNLHGTNLTHSHLNQDAPAYHRFLEPQPLRNLRQYTSFLTPRMGLFSGDTLAMIAIYMRNLLLNQTLMVATVAAMIALAQMLAPSILWAVPLRDSVFYLLVGVAFVSAITAAVCIGRCLGCLARNQHPEEPKGSSLWARIAALVTAASIWLLVPTVLTRYGGRPLLWGSATLLALACIVASLVSRATEGKEPELKPVKKDFAGLLGIGSSLAAGVFFLLLLYGFVKWLQKPDALFVGGGYVALGLPALLVALALTSYVHTGIYGNSFPDAKREWLGRLAGYFLFLASIGALVMVIALKGPVWMQMLFGAFGTQTTEMGWLKWLLPGGWLFTVLSGLLAAKNPSTGTPGGKSKLEILVKVAPPVFLIGVLLLVSWGVHGGVMGLGADQYLDWGSWQPASQVSTSKASSTNQQAAAKANDSQVTRTFKSEPLLVQYPHKSEAGSRGPFSPLYGLAIVALACGGIAFLLGRRLDVNEFSMHLFYRNRLVRAFLGASNPTRKPSPFTGFGLDDDMPLQDLCRHSKRFAKNHAPEWDKPYNGPYPLWGTALNLTSGEKLAWQKRKASSFIYSPLYCGWDYVPDEGPKTKDYAPDEKSTSDLECKEGLCRFGYRGTGLCTQSGEKQEPAYSGQSCGPYIGTALAASGAAVSPNWGYHTSPAVAAFLALFNIRIGWWSGNPRHEEGWREYAPRPHYLLHEISGSTGYDDEFVYLSDGGHFENLGVYELVRRRVRFIIACDADADPDYGFEDLGNAIEKCRRDFGVEIDMNDIYSLRPAKSDQDKSPADQSVAAKSGSGQSGQKPGADVRSGFSRQHWAVGEIKYPPLENGGQMKGILLYLKSSLSGDEPADVLSQHLSDPAFPHDTTLDQFFDETQFEAYRGLGEHMFQSIWEEFRQRYPANEKRTPQKQQIANRIQEFFEYLNRSYGPGSRRPRQSSKQERQVFFGYYRSG
jgi:hypothetical protein